MANINQAPLLKYNGNKMKDKKGWGKAIRTHELETAIMCGLGDRDMAMLKIMLFLTGNAEGFRVAEKTICERCKISDTGYKNARKKLVNMGWITHDSGSITVNYDVILGATENTPIINQKIKGLTENTPQGLTENTPQGLTENTHNNIRNNIINNINGGDVSATAEPTPAGTSPEEPIEKEKDWFVDKHNYLIPTAIPQVFMYSSDKKFYKLIK